MLASAQQQRSNSGLANNARIDLSWPDVRRWLATAGPAPAPASDTYSDGRCAGSVIGRVEAGGTIPTLEHLAGPFKVEGIVASAVGDTIDLLMVTDADNRRQPALLLAAALRR